MAASKKQTIMEYMEWRGDLNLKAVPFCEVDNLILSEASFIDWDGEVSADITAPPVPLREAADSFFQKIDLKSYKLGIVVPKQIPGLVQKMSESERFGQTCLLGAINSIDLGQEKQFAAETFLLEDGTAYVSFRGTDDTIVGWKEDLNLSFMEAVPAQLEAAEYLRSVAAVTDCPIRVGGHSKGGNLAIYAAANVDSSVQDRIINVYNNDGPGFDASFFDRDGFLRIADRVSNIFPGSSIVGMLFEHFGDVKITHSYNKGVMQHDGFSWQVMGNHFITEKSFSDEGLKINRMIKAFLAKMDTEQRKSFSNLVYEMIGATHSTTLTELNTNKIKLVKAYSELTPEGRKMMNQIIGSFFDEGRKVILEDLFRPVEQTVIPTIRELPQKVKKSLKSSSKKN